MFRRALIDVLSHEPRSISSIARELGLRRGDIEDDLRHALRSARAAGHVIEIVPARCKSCGFVFSPDKLSKPSRCPECKGTRLFEPLIRIEREEERRQGVPGDREERRQGVPGDREERRQGVPGDRD